MSINEIKKGMLAKSKAGHDKGRVYVICNVDNAYVYLVDGNIRTLSNPKKKKIKHINKTNTLLEFDENVSNSDVRKMLKKV